MDDNNIEGQRNAGYVVTLEPLKGRKELEIYGVVDGRILGSYVENPTDKRPYDQELFADLDGDGTMQGDFSAGGLVSIKREDFEKETRNVRHVREIDLS